MVLLKPTFIIPGNIPGISGQWGPFINTNFSHRQKRGLLMLLFVSIVLIIGFGAASYSHQLNNINKECNKIEGDNNDLSFFLNSNANISAFLLGMTAGMIFGFIDNGGLWYGMDSLDPVFDPSKVPWVYGKGGRRYFTGIDHNGNTVYTNTQFADGILNESEITKLNNISKKLESEYKEQLKLSEDTRETIDVNEYCYADPNSLMFIGSNMTCKEFIHKFQNRKINEKTYYDMIENYREYRKKFTSDSELLKNRKWPGIDKKIALDSLHGWTPGKLTQAGLGNTYSDILGGFVSTFIAVMIVNATGQCVNSLISEVLGLFFGCLLGILFGRLTTNKT